MARRTDEDHPDDRALDRLADRGPSRLGIDGARRARDVSRPSPQQLARAAAAPQPRTPRR